MGQGVVRLCVRGLGVGGLVAVQIFAPGRARRPSGLAGTEAGLSGLPRGSLSLVGDDVDPHPHVRQALPHSTV